MTREDLLDLFRRSGALLEGHFRLSSGLHSSGYLQCALVLQQPSDAETLGRAIAASSVKAIIGIGLTATKMYGEVKKAAAALSQAPPAFVDGGRTMGEMVDAARRFAKTGDVIRVLAICSDSGRREETLTVPEEK